MIFLRVFFLQQVRKEPENHNKKYLSDEELEAAVREVMADVGEAGRDMGKLMGVVMSKVKGRVNGNRVREMVEKILK